MLLLVLFYALEDTANVELHTADEGYLQHKCTHEVIEHLAALLLQVHRLVLLQVTQQLVMRHCQLHHAIHLALQFLLIALFQRTQVVVLFCKFAHIFLFQRANPLAQLDLAAYNLQFSLIILYRLFQLQYLISYAAYIFKRIVDFAIKELHPIDQHLLEGGLLGLLEEVEYFVIVSLDQRTLILVQDCNVCLKCFYDISQKTIILNDVFLEFAVDGLETVAVVPLCLAFQLHYVVDGVDQAMLELTGRLYALYLLVEQHPLHKDYNNVGDNQIMKQMLSKVANKWI